MENQPIKFSIVIPTFNRAALLQEAIVSVQNQSYSNWEIIVIDDGGNDDTKIMISKLNDARIHYFWQENKERGAARNAGVKISSGNSVLFLDSDDFILPEYLAYAVELIVDENPPCVHIPFSLTEGKTPSKASRFQNISDAILVSNLFGCPVILRKDIAEQFPFSENRALKIGEDWLLMLKLTARFEWIIGSKTLGRIRQHGERSMHSPDFKTVSESKEALKSELENDLLYNNHPTLFKNIDFEFGYLEITALLRESASKNEIIDRLRKLIAQKPSFLFSKRFLYVMKNLLLLK